jgi:hypothetical protein
MKVASAVGGRVADKKRVQGMAKEVARELDYAWNKKPRPGKVVIPRQQQGVAGPNKPVKSVKPRSSGKGPRSLSAIDKQKLKEISDIKDYAIPPKARGRVRPKK